MKNSVIVAAIMLGLLGCGGRKTAPTIPETNSDYANKSVKIMAKSLRAGGTGVILKSGPAGTDILTNKHVCELVQVGGIVRDDGEKDYEVQTYRVYTKHDLCMVHIGADLHNQTTLAKKGPTLYDPVTITGHPALLPSIITRGHFSKEEIIRLVIGFEQCDGSEQDEEAFMCMMIGAKPKIRQLPAQATSALIMPGSSGSGVFNSRGELSGLVFAGSEGLSYSFIVPWQFVQDFLNNQLSYKLEVPNAKSKPRSFFSTYFKFEGLCNAGYIQSTCAYTKRLGIYHNE